MVCVLILECIFGVVVWWVFMDVFVIKLKFVNYNFVNVGNVLLLLVCLYVDVWKCILVVIVRIR